jgi:hypothetical protein
MLGRRIVSATTEPAWSLIPAAMNGHWGAFLTDKCLDDYAPPVAGLFLDPIVRFAGLPTSFSRVDRFDCKLDRIRGRAAWLTS